MPPGEIYLTQYVLHLHVFDMLSVVSCKCICLRLSQHIQSSCMGLRKPFVRYFNTECMLFTENFLPGFLLLIVAVLIAPALGSVYMTMSRGCERGLVDTKSMLEGQTRQGTA